MHLALLIAYAQLCFGKLNISQEEKPGRREPSLRSSDCNAAQHPLLAAYEDSIWLNWSR
jgi:hypothetical protein